MMSPNLPVTTIDRKIEGNTAFLLAYQLKGKTYFSHYWWKRISILLF
jgi:hypothetical protein